MRRIVVEPGNTQTALLRSLGPYGELLRTVNVNGGAIEVVVLAVPEGSADALIAAKFGGDEPVMPTKIQRLMAAAGDGTELRARITDVVYQWVVEAPVLVATVHFTTSRPADENEVTLWLYGDARRQHTTRIGNVELLDV